MLNCKLYLLAALFILNSCANYVNRLHRDINKQRTATHRYPQSETNSVAAKNNSHNGNKKRFIADDFQDNEPSQSLWVGNGNESFFSTGGARKEKGDLVTILVYKALKSTIQNELERAFPIVDTKSEAKDKPATPIVKDDSAGQENKLYDKISSTVTKEIKNNHIVLSGRKQILFNKFKHLVEIKALVNRKDVTVDDTIESDKILQSSIKVLR